MSGSPAPVDLGTQVAQILDPELRVGDAARMRTGHPTHTHDSASWSVIESIHDDGTLTVAHLRDKGADIRQRVPRHAVDHYCLHLNRRPPHTQCIAPGCPCPVAAAGQQSVHITAWPDEHDKTNRQNWRWVLSCPNHMHLAIAYATSWAGGPGCILDVRDRFGQRIPASRWTPGRHPVVGPPDQLALF